MLFYNKYAKFKYETDREYEAGMSLSSSQVKEIRAGKSNLAESAIHIRDGELFWVHTGLMEDKVKLLLNRNEINKISAYLDEKRHHVFPLGIFTKGRMLKMKIATGVVKKQYQKTAQQKRRDEKQDAAREFKEIKANL